MECRHCAGRGFRYEEEGPCYVCHGKKKLLSEEEIRQHFKDINAKLKEDTGTVS